MVQATNSPTDWDADTIAFDRCYDSNLPMPCHQDSGKAGLARDRRHKLRSLSATMTWSRPKSSLAWSAEAGHAGYTNEAIIEDESDHEAQSAGASGHAQPAFGFKSIVRRASKSIKSMVHRRPSAQADEALGSRSGFARPTTSHSLWTGRTRQRNQSVQHSRSFYGLDYTQEPQYVPDAQAEGVQVPRPGTSLGPPIIPEHTGAAAKASAALQNEYMARSLQHKWLSPLSDEGTDCESGVGISVSGIDDDIEIIDIIESQQDISRVDFISQLPVELAIHVLACLDSLALSRASSVSRNWNKVCGNQHVWRESCLREMTTTYATSGSVRPNAGQGIPRNLPSSDWKEIYRAKNELDQRWKSGKAKPIYLNGHKDSIYCVQFDEYKLITGSRDKTIRVWDLHTFQCRLIIGPEEVLTREMLFNGDGGLVHNATGADSRVLCEGVPRMVSFPMHHNASILCLQYDEEILVTGSSDSTCIVYDIKAGYRPIRRLEHHTAAVLDLAFDDKHIVTCSKDISICVWDRATGALLKQLKGHTGPVNAVQMRGNTIVSCSGDYRVKLWNIDTGKNIREFAGHTKGLACSQFSEDGRLIASAGNDHTIRIWDANTGELVRKIDAHEGLVRSLHVDSVSGRLVSASYDTDIKVWDMETGRQLLDFPHWHASWVLSAKCDYRRIVSTGQDPKILVMDFGAGVRGIDLLESEDQDERQAFV